MATQDVNKPVRKRPEANGNANANVNGNANTGVANELVDAAAAAANNAGSKVDDESVTYDDLVREGVEAEVRQNGLENERDIQRLYNETPEEKEYRDVMRKYNNDVIALLSDYKREPQEDKDRLARDKRIAGVGDAISALANLYFTTQYAPNSYSKESQLSPKVQERYDKMLKDRDADFKARLEVLSGKSKLAGDMLKEARADRERQLGYRVQEENRKLTRDSNRLRQMYYDRIYNQKDQAAADAKEEKEAKRQMDKEKFEEQKRHNKATEATSATRAANSGSGRQQKTYEYNGREYPDQQSRDADIISDYKSMQGPTFNERGEKPSTQEMRSWVQDQRRKSGGRGKTGGQAGGSNKDKTPPSRQGKQDNTPPSRRK